MGEELTASKVFSSMVVFDKFNKYVMLYTPCLFTLTRVVHSLLRNMVLLTTQSLNGKVSLDRITDFLYDVSTHLHTKVYHGHTDVTIHRPNCLMPGLDPTPE